MWEVNLSAWKGKNKSRFSESGDRVQKEQHGDDYKVIALTESLQIQSEALGMGTAGNGNSAVWKELICSLGSERSLRVKASNSQCK